MQRTGTLYPGAERATRELGRRRHGVCEHKALSAPCCSFLPVFGLPPPPVLSEVTWAGAGCLGMAFPVPGSQQ